MIIFILKNSQHGIRYTEEKTQEAIIQFALNRLNIHISEISESQWKQYLHGKYVTQRPALIFTCNDQDNCFSSNERVITAVLFVNIMSNNI